jgi:hypothetical protein
MKTLNVIQTSKEEISKEWGFDAPMRSNGDVFARCNAKKQVNWDKTSIYTASELVKRGDYNVLKRGD